MRVLIIGAGIGGLTAALELRQAGFDACVYEQAHVLREVGAGVAISPNAVKVLHQLGLARELRDIAVVSDSLDSRDGQTGELLGRVPLAEAAVTRWGAPFYHLHRADLHSVLLRSLGDRYVTTGAHCIAVEQRASTVSAQFDDGRESMGDLLIGADGIHSVVREYVAGPDQPVWSRQVAWRGVAPAAVGHDLGLEVRHHSFWGPRKQFVCFYISAGRLVNWVGNTQTDDAWREESWSARGDRDEALRFFEGWHPQVRGLIADTEQVFKWALFDRLPLSKWTRGHVALLGDAAHPMLPYMAQGASQSIEDAFVLSRCLALDRDDPQRALSTYAAHRQERTSQVQAASRNAGRMMQLTDPVEIEARNVRLRSDPQAPIARFDWIWSYDVESAVTDG